MGNLIGRAYVALSLVMDGDGFGLRRQGTRTVYEEVIREYAGVVPLIGCISCKSLVQIERLNPPFTFFLYSNLFKLFFYFEKRREEQVNK